MVQLTSHFGAHGLLTILKINKMNRFENKGKNIFTNIMAIIILLFTLGGSIMFWVFIANGDVYYNWYPLIGHLVSSHGGLIAIIRWMYLRHMRVINRKK